MSQHIVNEQFLKTLAIHSKNKSSPESKEVHDEHLESCRERIVIASKKLEEATRLSSKSDEYIAQIKSLSKINTMQVEDLESCQSELAIQRDGGEAKNMTVSYDKATGEVVQRSGKTKSLVQKHHDARHSSHGHP